MAEGREGSPEKAPDITPEERDRNVIEREVNKIRGAVEAFMQATDRIGGAVSTDEVLGAMALGNGKDRAAVAFLEALRIYRKTPGVTFERGPADTL